MTLWRWGQVWIYMGDESGLPSGTWKCTECEKEKGEKPLLLCFKSPRVKVFTKKKWEFCYLVSQMRDFEILLEKVE